MTTLTASQLLVSHVSGRPSDLASGHASDRGLLDLLRGLARGLWPAGARGHTLAALPGHVLRDIGLDGVDLRAL